MRFSRAWRTSDHPDSPHAAAGAMSARHMSTRGGQTGDSASLIHRLHRVARQVVGGSMRTKERRGAVVARGLSVCHGMRNVLPSAQLSRSLRRAA